MDYRNAMPVPLFPATSVTARVTVMSNSEPKAPLCLVANAVALLNPKIKLPSLLLLELSCTAAYLALLPKSLSFQSIFITYYFYHTRI